MIFVEESHWAGVPLPLLTLNSVGPTLMSLGTDEQKERILPGILRGEVHFSIGYTEPTAGTDLASLRTRAVRDGDEYVITGEKLYTSAIQYADYVWLAARTDPDAPKHKGLSRLHRPHRRRRASTGRRCAPWPGSSPAPLSTTRSGCRRPTWWEGEPGVEADHQPAQPRAGGPLPGVGDPPQHRRRGRLGPGREAGRRQPGHRPASGSRSTWPACRPGPSCSSCSTGRWPGRPTRDSIRPMPPPPRSSGPSSPWRRTGSCSRSWVRPAISPRGRPGAVLAGPARAPIEERDHLHLRRRHQRGPAGHHRHDRPRACPGPRASEHAGDRYGGADPVGRPLT